MATYLSGRNCIASNGTTAFPSMFDWQLNETNELQRAMLSNTAFHEVVIPGNTDWSGSVGFAGRVPPVFPGDAVTLRLYPDGGTSAYWLATAICSRITVDCNVQGGNHIQGRMEFLANGALGTASAATMTDSTTPAMFTATSIKAQSVADDGTTTTDLSIRGWSLDYSNNCPTYADTSTAGQIKRTAGNFQFSGSIRLYEGTPANVLRAGLITELRLFTSATHYWRVKYAAFGGLSHAASRQTAENIGVEYPFSHSTAKEIAGTSTRGVLSYVGASTTTLFS